MTREEALEELGLEEGFSEEEFKRAYRDLARRYHPDNYRDKKTREKMQEKMKIVNQAHDYFVRLYKVTGTYLEIEAYRKIILNKMRAYYQNVTVGDRDLIRLVEEAANECARLVNFRDGKAGLDNVFEQFLTKLKKVYSNYRDNFYEENYIDEFDVKEIINYNVNVEEFYMQLSRIRDKYSRKIIFEKRVQEEIAPYKMYATCTEHLWKLISIACVHNAIIKAEKSGYRNMDEAIEALHEEISGLFSLVDELNANFREVKQELESIDDETLNEECQNLEARYNKGDALADIQNGLKKLKRKIEDYKKEQIRLAKLKENEKIVNGKYQMILVKFNEFLQSCNPVEQKLAIDERLKLMQTIVELFDKYRNGLIELDNLLMLDLITFSDLENDKQVIQAVEGRDEGTRGNSNIYLKKKAFLILEDTSFFELSEDNGEYFITRMGVNSASKTITLEDLSEEYISLEEVVEKARYVGATAKWFGVERVFVLYEVNVGDEKRLITLKDGYINIYKEGMLSDFYFADWDVIKPYKDKEFLIAEIEQQLQKSKEQKYHK